MSAGMLQGWLLRIPSGYEVSVVQLPGAGSTCLQLTLRSSLL